MSIARSRRGISIPLPAILSLSSSSIITNTSEHSQSHALNHPIDNPQTKFKMQFPTTLAVFTALLAASPAAAWTFTWRDATSHVSDGSANKGCTNISHTKGKTFSWDRGTFESCCIRLYSGSSCVDQVGLSCPDWSKAASQDLKSYKVTDC